MNDNALQDLIEFLRGRFFGKYRGVVVDVDAATMRVKASVPSVFGGVTSGWAAPCVPYAGPQVGFLMLPDVGSGVWIEFEGGDVSLPIWTGCYWNTGDIPSSAATTQKSIVTKAGNPDSTVLKDLFSHLMVVTDYRGAAMKWIGRVGIPLLIE